MAVTNGSNTIINQKDIWETDPAVVRALECELGFRFDVDVCGTPFNRKAPWVITKDPRFFFDWSIPGLRCSWDAFATEWHKVGRYGWMNAPFSQKEKFIAMAEHFARRGMTVVGPLPVAMSATWYRDMEQGADRILVPDGRINYVHPMTGKIMKGVNFETVIAVWRPRKSVTVERISLKGGDCK